MKIAGRTYSTEITKVMKNAMLLNYFSAFMKKNLANENTDFIFNYAVMKKKPLWLYWNFVDETASQQINIASKTRNDMKEAILAPGKVDMKALNAGLVTAYGEIVNLVNLNFENAFAKSEYAREFAYSVIKTDGKKVAKLLGIKNAAAISLLKPALIDYAMGNEKEGAKNLAAALVKDKPKAGKPSPARLDKAVKILKKAL